MIANRKTPCNRRLGFALAILAALLAPALAQAAAGDLDRSFSKNGIVTPDFCRHFRSTSVAVDDHGRIVAAGNNHRSGKFCVARFRRDGRFDDSFSGNGKVTTDFGGAVAARAVAVDSRGRIVVAGGYGRWRGQLTSVALARYEPDGTLDRSFSGDGKTTMPFGGAYIGDRCESSCHDHPRSVAIDSRDRIIVAGGSFHDFALARYRGNGSLDPSFGADGVVKTDFVVQDVARSVAIDRQGRIVAVGDACNGAPCDFALARYESDGDLDPSFGGDGRVTTEFGTPPAHARSVAIDSPGRIFVAGQRRGPNYRFALASYEPTGDLDPSFGGNGKVTTGFPHPNVGATAVAIMEAQQRIVAVGGIGVGGDFDIARYKPNGRLDRSFSENGKVRTDFGRSTFANSVAIDHHERIVVGGWHRKLVIARYIGFARR